MLVANALQEKILEDQTLAQRLKEYRREKFLTLESLRTYNCEAEQDALEYRLADGSVIVNHLKQH